MERDDDTAPGADSAPTSSEEVTTQTTSPAGAREEAAATSPARASEEAAPTSSEVTRPETTRTVVEALPVGARAIDPLASIADPESARMAARVRDEALEQAVTRTVPAAPDKTSTVVDAIPVGARAIDPLASIADPESARMAARVRAEALQRHAGGGDIDIHSTIVTKRAATAAEQLRDMAYDKLREGSEEDLRATIAVNRSPQSEDPRRATSLDVRATAAADPRRTSSLDVRATSPDPRDDIPALEPSEQALVETLRGLPPEGQEPDWNALEESIRRRTRMQPTFVPWWRDVRYIAPLGAVAAIAVVVLIVKIMGASRPAAPGKPASASVDRPSDRTDGEAFDVGPMVWIDGQPVDLDSLDTVQLELAPFDSSDLIDADSTGASTRSSDLLEGADTGVLPVSDFTWLESLDDAELQRVERWLAGKRS
jgi:hypothetical protein